MTSTNEKIESYKSVLEIGLFCRCRCSSGDDDVHHICQKFPSYNVEHAESCRCCQTRYFTRFIGSLIDEDKVQVSDDTELYAWKIENRAYDLDKDGSSLLFKIERHPDASNPMLMSFVTQKWQFDINNRITLDLVNHEDNDEANYEYLRRYFGEQVNLSEDENEDDDR
jgi:hypothetical protein